MGKKWCLIGLPDDTGVQNVGGRPGAAQGPAAFRSAWERLKGRAIIKESCTDAGDVELIESIEENHDTATAVISRYLAEYDFSIIIGGGHDLLLPHLRAYHAQSLKSQLGCINIDPHYDLRPDVPLMTSGSALYAALEHGVLSPDGLLAFGIQEPFNAEGLRHYAAKKRITEISFDQIRGKDVTHIFRGALEGLAQYADTIVLSLDMDSFQAAFAPGVSAPAVEGFDPSQVIEMVRIAAAMPQVVSLGIYELNPEYDIDHRTAFLAATVAYHFAAVKLAGQ